MEEDDGDFRLLTLTIIRGARLPTIRGVKRHPLAVTAEAVLVRAQAGGDAPLGLADGRLVGDGRTRPLRRRRASG
ncbi:hypothetical protein GCM10011574_23140 [Microbispora bryophytorum]|uniref:Uncharacterized protein n=1 Tax=Microbispora bryophytorum TaxID=1460882 RepID=A0A8H9GZJ4_9ACTN|nr:hypothetical protein GCM10011574_23140 [Microbispora bryophytorum]